VKDKDNAYLKDKCFSGATLCVFWPQLDKIRPLKALFRNGANSLKVFRI